MGSVGSNPTASAILCVFGCGLSSTVEPRVVTSEVRVRIPQATPKRIHSERRTARCFPESSSGTFA